MFSDHDYGDDDEKCEHCSPSDSISSEISMDESFLKRLFKACDRDNDGFLDRYGILCYLPCLHPNYTLSAQQFSPLILPARLLYSRRNI